MTKLKTIDNLVNTIKSQTQNLRTDSQSVRFMNKGLWVWPSDPRGQRKVLRKVATSPHLMSAMAVISKSKE